MDSADAATTSNTTKNACRRLSDVFTGEGNVKNSRTVIPSFEGSDHQGTGASTEVAKRSEGTLEMIGLSQTGSR